MDRVAAVRARLDQVSAVARLALEAGPGCSNCRFRTLLGACGNPAYAEARFDPSKGSYEEMFITPVVKARADDGLCGPEALLYEPLDLPAVAGKVAWISAQTIWFGAVSAVLLIFLLGR